MSAVARAPSSDPSCQPHVWLLPVEIVSLSAQSRMPPLVAGCQRKTRRTVQATPLWDLSFPSASEGAGLNGLKAHWLLCGPLRFMGGAAEVTVAIPLGLRPSC